MEVHDTHNPGELKQNLHTAVVVAKASFQIRLLPVDNTPHRKNPDACFFRQDVMVEFKCNLTPTRSAIEEAIRKRRKQDDHLVLHILSDVSRADLLAGIRNRMYFAENVKHLWLIRSDEVVSLSRNEVFDGTMALKIK